MTKPIKGKDGKFQGSIGEGKAKIPTAAAVPQGRATHKDEAAPKDHGSLYDLFRAKISPRAARTQERNRQFGLALRAATNNGSPKMADTNAAARAASRHAVPDCGRTYCDCGPHNISSPNPG